ncbi:recombination mediator RecR [Acholeplasma sp. OttesenSCG-928-E16]|nr:recombination mediator RecR [Acholeplasma sp. OttesenSCG-928-E16]
MYPKLIKDLIDDFKKLPGIGEKGAERLVLHVVTKMNEEDITKLKEDLSLIKEKITYCKKCHMISDSDVCKICQDPKRDQKTIMVVGEIKDVVVMEKTNTYHGLYHVLGGLIDFSKGITEQDLYIDDLMVRLDNISEVILATDGTVEGEITAKYLNNILKEKVNNVTRLAYGLPVGMDLKYADELTISKAISNRAKY